MPTCIPRYHHPSQFIFNLPSLIIFWSELQGGLWVLKAGACDLCAEPQCLGFPEESTACWWSLWFSCLLSEKKGKKKHVEVGCQWAERCQKGKKIKDLKVSFQRIKMLKPRLLEGLKRLQCPKWNRIRDAALWSTVSWFKQYLTQVQWSWMLQMWLQLLETGGFWSAPKWSQRAFACKRMFKALQQLLPSQTGSFCKRIKSFLPASLPLFSFIIHFCHIKWF